VNKKRVFKLTFEFKASDGTTHRAVARTHITETLEDEPFETVLYDPHNPSHNLMLDGLPGAIRFDESGAPVVGAPRKALTYLILPLVSLIAAAGTAVVLMKML
jgi:hypothetical protein